MSNLNNTSLVNNTTKAPEAVTELWLVYGIDYVIVALAIIFHIIGIASLWKTKSREISNQSILLIHLSMTSFPSIILNAIAIYHKAHRMYFPEGFIVCYNISHMAYILSLIYLAFDRLLFVLLTLKYRIYIVRLVIIVALVILWCIALSYGVMMEFGKLVNHSWYVQYSSYIYNGFVIVFTTVAYLSIIFKVIVSSRLVASSTVNAKTKIRKYAVPFCIVMTFFLFVFLPSLIANEVLPMITKYYRRTFLIGLIGLNVLNNVFDPIIYIFLQPKIRKKLRRYISRVCTHTKKTLSDTVVYKRKTRKEKASNCTLDAYSHSSLVNIRHDQKPDFS